MSDVSLLSYVGAATGIIGSITGIAGAIMGYIAYRRSNMLKSLDLRMELKKSRNSAFAAHEKSLEVIEESEKSRKAVSAAMGRFGSGGMKQWEQDLAKDKRSIEKLVYELPHPTEDYDSLSAKELETKIVEIHRLQTYVQVYVDKYTKELASDDEDRKFLRDQAHSRG